MNELCRFCEPGNGLCTFPKRKRQPLEQVREQGVLAQNLILQYPDGLQGEAAVFCGPIIGMSATASATERGVAQRDSHCTGFTLG